MRLYIKVLVLLIFILTTTSGLLVAQSPSSGGGGAKDRQLADQYMTNGEFDKAAVMYEKLYEKDDPQGVYGNYYYCLIQLRYFDVAEKLVKRAMKKYPDNPSYLVDLGYIYFNQGDLPKAHQQYDKAIKQLHPDQGIIIQLANAFANKQETDYAMNTYLEGRKLMKGQYSFSFELAEIYYRKQDFQKMIDEYLNALSENNAYIQNVQNILQSRIANDPDGKKNDMLRQSLLRKVQKSPDETIFSNLLIWLFIQQKDFESAFIQAKALDKRQHEDGGRIMSLGSLAASNLNYDAAIKCYQYVIEKGTESAYYISARMELLNTLNRKITESNTYIQADLLKLEKDYESTLSELGKSAETAPLIRGLAHLQVFYLDKTEDAINSLREAIAYSNIKPQYQAECKLELGDILLFTGDVWESSLLYSQVDLAFKHDELGQEAKFRNAKLNYYRGDFQWAQAQLDVLKSATSQLMANDALALSLLISDNTAMDTSTAPLMMYSHADLLSYQRKNDDALLILDSILILYPGHTITGDVWFKKSKIMDVKRNFAEEDSLLKKIVDIYPEGVIADDAVFLRAELYENKLNDKAKAMELYEEILTKYPGSLYCVEARKRFRSLRGDSLN